MFDAAAYLSPLAVTGLTTLSYLLGYTMYSKQEKTLVPALLIKVLTFSEGLEHTLVEANKVHPCTQRSCSQLHVRTPLRPYLYCAAFSRQFRCLASRCWH